MRDLCRAVPGAQFLVEARVASCGTALDQDQPWGKAVLFVTDGASFGLFRADGKTRVCTILKDTPEEDDNTILCLESVDGLTVREYYPWRRHLGREQQAGQQAEVAEEEEKGEEEEEKEAQNFDVGDRVWLGGSEGGKTGLIYDKSADTLGVRTYVRIAFDECTCITTATDDTHLAFEVEDPDRLIDRVEGVLFAPPKTTPDGALIEASRHVSAFLLGPTNHKGAWTAYRGLQPAPAVGTLYESGTVPPIRVNYALSVAPPAIILAAARGGPCKGVTRKAIAVRSIAVVVGSFPNVTTK